MAVADLVGEWFETELLRATMAADGIFGAMLGPWSAGSGLQLLLAAANRSLAWPGGQVVARRSGAHGARAEARGRAIGVEIRTGAGVARIDRQRRARQRRRRSAGGERIEARAVVSARRSRSARSSHCAIRSTCRPSSCGASSTTARAARSRRSTSRCRRCRRSPAPTREMLAAASASRPTSTTSSARSTTRSTAATRRSRGSSSRSRRSSTRAGARGRARAVGVRAVRAVPAARHDWDAERDALGEIVTSTRSSATRRASRPHRRAAGPHAARPRARLGPHRRPHLPRRAGARSVLHDASAARVWPTTAHRSRPFTVRLRHAPGHRPHRGIRGKRGRGDCTRSYLTVVQRTYDIVLTHARRLGTGCRSRESMEICYALLSFSSSHSALPRSCRPGPSSHRRTHG